MSSERAIQVIRALRGNRNQSAFVALLLVVCASLVEHSRSEQLPDVNRIVEQSSRAADADRRASENYEYSETDLQPDGSHKTFVVHMLSGSPYEELVAINGRSLPGDQRKKEQRKLQREISKREHESDDERAQRVAKFHKQVNRDRRFFEEIPRAFQFEAVGEQKLGDRQVYHIQAMPRPNYRPPDRSSAVLTGMHGELWIDKQTYQWVKIEAEVIHPVSIEGFLAKVEPGTHFALEKMPVDGEVWLPKHFAMTSKAKVLLLIPYHGKQDETYFDYHKIGS